MKNEDKTFLILKYGDYHKDPELILNFDNDILIRVYKAVRGYDNIRWIKICNENVLKFEILMLIRHYENTALVTDRVLLENEQ